MDIKDKDDIYTCAEYAKDISIYLIKREKVTEVKEVLLANQIEIKERHREKVIEWLVDAQLKFKLKDETLYMATDIVDRFLDKQKVTRSKVSLLALVSILIASKYEEIYPPHLKDFIMICDDEFSHHEIFSMELSVMKALDFDLSTPNILTFLKRFSKFTNADETKQILAMFICEAQLLSSKMANYPHSLLAMGGLYLAEKAVNNDFKIEKLPLDEASHTKEELYKCANEMLGNMLIKEKIALSNIRRKYGKYKDIVRIPLNSNLLALP